MSDSSVPTCFNCGYALLGLVEPRCPECGKEFDPAYVEQFEARRLLLPWERPEDGGPITPVLKTTWLACVHPKRYFTNLDQRRRQPIRRAGRLILFCVIASLIVHAAGAAIEAILNVIFLSSRRGGLSGAIRIVLQTQLYGLRTFWFFPSFCILTWLQTVFLCSVVIGGVCRKEFKSLRLAHHSAVLAPILVAAGVFSRLMLIAFVIVIRIKRFHFIAELMGWALTALLGLLIWQCCRKYLKLSRIISAGVTILCLVIQHYSGWPASAILQPLLRAVIGTA